MVKSHKRLSGVEKGKGYLLPMEKGQCSKGDQCSFQHESNDRAKPTPKAEPPSEPQSSKTRGRIVSRKRNARGRRPSEKFNRLPCNYFLKGICTKSPCDYWHPPECQFCNMSLNLAVNSSQSARFRTGRLRNTQIQRPKKGGDKSAVAIVKNVRQLGRVSQDAEPPECSTILRMDTENCGPEKKKSIAEEKTRQTSSSSQSYAVKLRSRV